MVAQERVEEKIRKLIRLSENNPSEEEAARALEQAATLAAKYHLDISAIGVDADQDPMLARGSDIVLSPAHKIGVPVTPEEPVDAPTERCCFCRAVTDTWTNLPDRKPGEQVACCVRCARNATPAHVPSKKEWCEREAVAMGPGAGFRAEFERDRERWAEAKCWEGYR